MRSVDGPFMVNECSAMPSPKSTTRNSGLFVIRQLGRDMYWTCSSEHGCGWNPSSAKQSFSKSELTRQIAQMIDNDQFTNVEIIQLRLSA